MGRNSSGVRSSNAIPTSGGGSYDKPAVSSKSAKARVLGALQSGRDVNLNDFESFSKTPKQSMAIYTSDGKVHKYDFEWVGAGNGKMGEYMLNKETHYGSVEAYKQNKYAMTDTDVLTPASPTKGVKFFNLGLNEILKKSKVIKVK